MHPLSWCFWITTAFGATDFSKHGQFWSGSSNKSASITANGQWQNVEGANMFVNLLYRGSVYIDYNVAIEGLKSLSLNSFPLINKRNTLQMRCTVDNIPYRSSSSYISSYATEERIARELSGVFVANLSAKSHFISLQWKKSGGQIIRWVMTPTISSVSFFISVIADHDELWFHQETTSSIINVNGLWRSLSETVDFTLDEESKLITGYSVTVQPQIALLLKDRRQEYISTRLVVDGIPYHEGAFRDSPCIYFQ